MAIHRIPLSEHESRRRKILTALKGSVGLLFAGEHRTPDTPYRPHPHFEYLTGVVDEPGAVLLLDPGNPVAARRVMLFLKPLNPERDRWDGYRSEIASSLRERTGISSLYRTDALPRMLNIAARRSRRLACLHPPATYDRPLPPDLAVFRRIAERLPGVSIEDRTNMLDRMRAVKSRNELALMQHAIDITTAGFAAMFETVRPGVNEFEVQEAIEHAYRSRGARAAAFPTIVGSGLNSTVLHYVANDQPLAEAGLVCIDSGALYAGYAADVTRTVPVNGRFSTRQREVYEVVLRAEQAAIKAVKPGVTFEQLDAIARKIITTAGFGDHFIHSIGHHLGLQTHDVAPDEPLRQGAVITIEPGIYLREESIGVRLEDDVLVTKDGARVLSGKIPKSVSAVEKAMGRE